MPKPVICDQCGFEIEQPEYARLSPTRRQMRCSVKNGRPRQRIVGAYSGCQVKYHNSRQKEKRAEKKQLIPVRLPRFNMKPSTVRGNYKRPDDEGPLPLGRPVGSTTQKGIRGKYNNNGTRKLRECLGILCTEEDKGRKFMSAGPFNRICPRCDAAEENSGGKEVKWAGVY